MRKIAKYFYHIFLDIIYSNDRTRIKEVKFHNRKQLVWISEFVGRRIALKIFEKEEVQFFESIVKDGDQCLDVGGNVGYFTHLFASLNGTGNVISIEALPKNVALMNLNIAINGTHEKVKLVNAAVGETNGGHLDFDTTSDSAFGFVHNEKERGKDSTQLKQLEKKILRVPRRTIDSIIEELNIPNIDVVKMDIEGFEYFALLGMEKLLGNATKKPRVLMIELFDEHLNHYDSSIDDVVKLLEKHGYTPKYLKDGKLLSMSTELYNKKSNVFFESV